MLPFIKELDEPKLTLCCAFLLATRTLDEGRGLDFGSYSRMLRIPKHSAWT